MRKALVAGAAAVVLIVAAFVVATTVWSQERSDGQRSRDRRVFMLDGRGSAIGVSIRDLEAEEAAKAKIGNAAGVFIEDVEEDSPAAKAGIREGDIVVEFDGERVRSARHFARLVQETADGRVVKATIVRDGTRQTLDVTPERGSRAFDMVMPDFAGEIDREVQRGLRSLPRNFAFDLDWDARFPTAMVWPHGRLGAQLTPLTDQLATYFGAKEGVLVSSVDSDSIAAKAGLKAGDVITTINGHAVDSAGDISRQIRESTDDKQVEIGILRDRKPMTLKAPLPEPRRSTQRRYVRPA